MDNNKKQQQNFTRSKACQSAESNCSRKSTTELQLNKPWPRNSRRREQPFATRNDSQRNSKQFPSVKAHLNVDKRPRPRGGGSNVGPGGSGHGGASCADDDGLACASEDVSAAGAGLATPEQSASGAMTKKSQQQQTDYELNSVHAPGSKKQNLNHLLNFHYASRESDYAPGLSVFGRGNGGGGAAGGMQRHHHQHGGGVGKRHKYNKEQFLQANFQFVIKPSARPALTGSPDVLIDWNLIEQINIQTTEEPQCPICLYPPIAAKLTRCGHAYCWPCILHYLALSDKSWRKCPICYEAIHTADLKSTTIIQQLAVSVGDLITFQLMRRRKGSMFIERYDAASPLYNLERYPQVSGSDESKLFSKFLIAKCADILDIIEREQRELIADEDPTCPEFVFIQQALDLLKDRREKLLNSPIKEENEEEVEMAEQKEPKPEEEKTDLNSILEQVEVDAEGEKSNNECSISSEDQATNLADAINTPITPVAPIASASSNAKYYYFYQSKDGQNIYLHPLNVKMLQACYGTLDRAPLLINAAVLQKEHHSMDEERRRKFTCLGHLPLTCQFAVVEVDLQPPTVTGGILRLFREDILFRKKERQRREREERKREKQINEINDRQMGKLIASTANLNLSSAHEFPSWGFEESLPSLSEAYGNEAVDAAGSSSVVAAKSSAIATPKRQVSYSTVAVVGESRSVGEYWPTLASPSNSNHGGLSSNIYHELSTWGKSSSSVANPRRAASDRSSECESINELAAADADMPGSPLRTELGDVLAMAISQKKQRAAGIAGGKKHNKKTKKMLPLFSTGINYNGN